MKIYKMHLQAWNTWDLLASFSIGVFIGLYLMII